MLEISFEVKLISSSRSIIVERSMSDERSLREFSGQSKFNRIISLVSLLNSRCVDVSIYKHT